jgi:hypothetical protein
MSFDRVSLLLDFLYYLDNLLYFPQLQYVSRAFLLCEVLTCRQINNM